MKLPFLILLAVCGSLGQEPQNPIPGQLPESNQREAQMRRSQREEMIKADYQKNLADAVELEKLAEELKTELEKGDRNVVSVKALKKTEDIEKLAKTIHGRLKRY